MEDIRKHLGIEADDYVESIREISPEFAKVDVEFPFEWIHDSLFI